MVRPLLRNLIGTLTLGAFLIVIIVTLAFPDALLGEIRPDKRCTGSSTGCCGQSDGCDDNGQTSGCPGGAFAESMNYTGTAYSFCEPLLGDTCEQEDVQCCEIKWYYEDGCANEICVSHKKQPKCD